MKPNTYCIAVCSPRILWDYLWNLWEYKSNTGVSFTIEVSVLYATQRPLLIFRVTGDGIQDYSRPVTRSSFTQTVNMKEKRSIAVPRFHYGLGGWFPVFPLNWVLDALCTLKVQRDIPTLRLKKTKILPVSGRFLLVSIPSRRRDLWRSWKCHCPPGTASPVVLTGFSGPLGSVSKSTFPYPSWP